MVLLKKAMDYHSPKSSFSLPFVSYGTPSIAVLPLWGSGVDRGDDGSDEESEPMIGKESPLDGESSPYPSPSPSEDVSPSVPIDIPPTSVGNEPENTTEGEMQDINPVLRANSLFLQGVFLHSSKGPQLVRLPLCFLLFNVCY